MSGLGLLLGTAFLGTFVWVFNAEALLLVQVARYGANPALAALAAAVGQLAAWVILFAAGHRIRARWSWFDRQCERVRTRWGARLRRHALVVIAVSGVLGVPPTSTVAVLAPGADVAIGRLLVVLFVGRFVRFLTLALLAERFVRDHLTG